jgi:gliding motility-associated-like protein
VRAQVIDTVCANAINAIYSVDLHQGAEYAWSVEGGTILSGNGSNSIIVNWEDTRPGLYKLSVSERNVSGCFGDIQTAFVLVRGTLFKASFPDKGCLFDSVTIHASGGRWYHWSNGATDSTIAIKLNGDTSLNVIISDTVCGLTADTFPVSIKAISKPDVAITTDVEQVYKNQPFFLEYNGSKDDNISWKIGAGGPNKNTQRIRVQLNDTGEVIVQLVVTNQLGCSDSAYRKIEVIADRLFFPTAFSPNGDGLNDVFKPGGMETQSFQLNIFNSWGQLVFTTNDPNIGWDGTFDAVPVMTGVYIYQCDVVSFSGRKQGFNGTVTLIR